ncbi:MAG: 4a-hydroxytetrahydrobiopterin dehydratase [Pseudomonadota bacterium]
MATVIGVEKAIEKLDGWRAVDGRNAIIKTFQFGDFKEAWAFMTRVAMMAEQMDHHPEWMNVYGTVKVTLITHDAGDVTQLDLDLASYMDACE